MPINLTEEEGVQFLESFASFLSHFLDVKDLVAYFDRSDPLSLEHLIEGCDNDIVKLLLQNILQEGSITKKILQATLAESLEDHFGASIEIKW